MSVQQIKQLWESGASQVVLTGGRGAHLAYVLSQVTAQQTRPLWIVTPEADTARALARDIRFFLGQAEDASPQVLLFPEVELSPYTEISPDRAATIARLSVQFELTQSALPRVIVSSAAALQRKVTPYAGFMKLCDLVVAEEEFDRDAMASKLVAAGYLRTQVVEDSGTFAVRGGILDFFPAQLRYPVRVEFYGDFVETIRLFDPATQRTMRTIKEVVIHPVRETVPTKDVNLRQQLLQLADSVNFPSRGIKTLLEALEEGRDFLGIEAIAPVFHEPLVPLPQYLSARPGGAVAPIWVLFDQQRVHSIFEQELERAETAYQARIADNRLAYPPAAFWAQPAELANLWQRTDRSMVVELSAPGHLDAQYDPIALNSWDNADVVVELQRARSDKGGEILKGLAARIRQWLSDNVTVLIAASTEAFAHRIEALLRGYNLHPVIQSAHDAKTFDMFSEARLIIAVGELGQGFRLDAGLVVLSEEEIFGPKVHNRANKRRVGQSIGDLADLKIGDWVVHATHGVGCYQGLVKMEVQGIPSDFLFIEYAGGDRLYLPVYRMDQVRRYVGAEGVPKLDRLGGQTWLKKQSKVKEEVKALGEELLQLYAQRAALQGYAFPLPGSMYNEFEASFPFTETPDQQQAIYDMLNDMQGERPMDRLICGDVGFGKTEVAMRAAFHAATSGKQVAVLAPTTVLVEQHYRTFSERFAPYPVRIEKVSRFRPTAELRQVLVDLADGKVDVVIGTHRLLSSDVRFSRLGLLVVDEEQRFGVTHKERIKRLRSQVDILTLTATPIPRTMQMSMIGLREISVISTPPVDRLAVRTFIGRFEDAVVTDAVRRELDRGGQIFFVHNRIEDIQNWAVRLQQLVPEARIVVGHGQMPAGQLEEVMVDFVRGAYDVLVSTTIIESGLDIPRANTMFVNDADNYGLSQLYQLRGRIGRSRHRAFCYLLVPGIEKLSDQARARLEVLQQFTQLGSGFSVASHDLELRGAGDLLGARQSGQIAAVGFETYARILEDAVAELKGTPIHRETDPEINVRVPAYIPDDYIEDTGQRLEWYQRLSCAARDEHELSQLAEEMKDRYGPAPTEVDALISLMQVKGLAIQLKVLVLDIATARISLAIEPSSPLPTTVITKLISDKKSGYKLTSQGRLVRELIEEEGDQAQPLEAAKQTLQQLLSYV